MTYSVDDSGENPHVNYEPSVTAGLKEASRPGPNEYGPVISGRLTRAQIPRTNATHPRRQSIARDGVGR